MRSRILNPSCNADSVRSLSECVRKTFALANCLLFNHVYKRRARSGGNVHPPVHPATLTNFSTHKWQCNFGRTWYCTLGLKYRVLGDFYFILTVSLKIMFCADSWITGFADFLFSKHRLTFWCRNYFFNLAHPVYKM